MLEAWIQECYAARGGRLSPDGLTLFWSLTVSVLALGGLLGGLALLAQDGVDDGDDGVREPGDGGAGGAVRAPRGPGRERGDQHPRRPHLRPRQAHGLPGAPHRRPPHARLQHRRRLRTRPHVPHGDSPRGRPRGRRHHTPDCGRLRGLVLPRPRPPLSPRQPRPLAPRPRPPRPPRPPPRLPPPHLPRVPEVQPSCSYPSPPTRVRNAGSSSSTRATRRGPTRRPSPSRGTTSTPSPSSTASTPTSKPPSPSDSLPHRLFDAE